jgi:hypothetical protein
MTEDKSKVFSDIKQRILKEAEIDSKNYDRLMFLQKSKELLGFLKATYEGFAPVLDSPIASGLSIEEYQKMHRMLVKATINGVDFTGKMKAIINAKAPPPPTTPQKDTHTHTEKPTINTQSKVEDIPKQIAACRKEEKRDEPWVI